MGWKDRPRAGERWQYRKTPGRGFVVEWPSETRTVVDRTLGGAVIYISGRVTRNAPKEQCSEQDWLAWQHYAKPAPRARRRR